MFNGDSSLPCLESQNVSNVLSSKWRCTFRTRLQNNKNNLILKISVLLKILIKHSGIECIPIFNFNIHALCNLVHKLLVILQNWEVISLQLNVQSSIQWNFCLSSLKERYNKQFLQLKPIMMKNEKLSEAHDFQISILWHTVPKDFVFIVKKMNFILCLQEFAPTRK